MEAITNTTNEQKCNKNIVDAMPALYAFALQQQVPVSDTFCWHSQHCSPGAVCLHTRIKLYGYPELMLLLQVDCLYGDTARSRIRTVDHRNFLSDIMPISTCSYFCVLKVNRCV